MTDVVPDDELQFRVSRSSGPGGQHVNKTSSRVEAIWDLEASRGLDDARRATLRSRLCNRLDHWGRLVVACSTDRSQHRNKAEAVRRLRALVAAALEPPRPRTRTAPTRSSREARLEGKRRQSARKVDRRPPE